MYVTISFQRYQAFKNVRNNARFSTARRSSRTLGGRRLDNCIVHEILIYYIYTARGHWRFVREMIKYSVRCTQWRVSFQNPFNPVIVK